MERINYGTRKVNARGRSLQITLPATYVRTFNIREGMVMKVYSVGRKLFFEVQE